jgi:membrane protein YqaA with SNARE-associated domain
MRTAECRIGGAEADVPRGRFLNALLGWPGLVAGFVWGFAEASFFFVVPDVIISLVTMFSPRQGLKQVGAALVGATVGGMLLFSLAHHDPDAAHGLLRHVPWLRAGMIEDARRDFHEEGAWGMMRGPAKGLPYKVYAVLAPAHISWLAFLLVTPLDRVSRFFGTWMTFSAVRWFLRRRIDAHPRITIAAMAVKWLLFYHIVVRAVVEHFSA